MQKGQNGITSQIDQNGQNNKMTRMVGMAMMV